MKAYKKLLYWLFAMLLITTACFSSFAGTETDLQLTLTAASRGTDEGQTDGVAKETSTPFVSWAGSWTTWIVIDQPRQVTMTLLQSGEVISGTSTEVDGTVATIKGFLSADFSQASGSWEHMLDEGKFEWRQINPDQFVGYYTIDSGNEGRTTFPWCGARNGASQPDPCFGP